MGWCPRVPPLGSISLATWTAATAFPSAQICTAFRKRLSSTACQHVCLQPASNPACPNGVRIYRYSTSLAAQSTSAQRSSQTWRHRRSHCRTSPLQHMSASTWTPRFAAARPSPVECRLHHQPAPQEHPDAHQDTYHAHSQVLGDHGAPAPRLSNTRLPQSPAPPRPVVKQHTPARAPPTVAIIPGPPQRRALPNARTLTPPLACPLVGTSHGPHKQISSGLIPHTLHVSITPLPRPSCKLPTTRRDPNTLPLP